MPKKSAAQRKRAQDLRKQIGTLSAAAQDPNPVDDPNMEPGESPKEYVERRMRELDQVKKPKPKVKKK